MTQPDRIPEFGNRQSASAPLAGKPGDVSLAHAQPARQRSITWRSLLLGTVAVVLVCALTPYNDFVLSDTSLAAGYLPLAAVLFVFLLVTVVNAPLHRWAPLQALSTGELAVIVLMLLIACSLPNWGLMRFLIPMPVAPFRQGAYDGQFWQAFLQMDLPKWLFPVSDIHEGRADPVVTWFYSRIPEGTDIPYGAWIRPLLGWGVFIAAMLATLVAVARLVLEQWAVNERLPFPLVQVQMALLEAPQPGYALNRLFRSKGLWAALTVVFVIHSLGALNSYYPKYFPRVPLGYDLSGILSEPPFSYLRGRVKQASLFFMLVGVTYFIRSRVAFSMWVIYLVMNLVTVEQRRRQSDLSAGMWSDQHLGACAAFVLGILWIGRHHWLRVLRNALFLGTDRTYRMSFWITVAGIATMIGWLWVVGVQLWMAGLIVLFILVAHLVVSRVVAETGLPWYRVSMAVSQVYSQFNIGWLTARDVYFSGVFTALGPLTTRDSPMSFALHGLGVCQSAGLEQRQQRKIGLVVAWALLLGCIVAAYMTLRCQYSYPTPGASDASPQRNYFGAVRIPQRELTEPMTRFSAGRFEPQQHNSLRHISIGFVVTALLEIGSLRWAKWPLLPVGYVTSYGPFIETAWFSIFVGWLLKVLIVKYGGSSLFQKSRPVFVGLIFGEALAAAIWLVINAALVLGGAESRPIRFLP